MVPENPWKKLHSDTVYQNPWIAVEEHQVLTPAGKPGIYGVVRPQNLAIGIVPLDEALHTWLVGQWRYPLQRYSWEIPEGGCPVGMLPQEAAEKELAEETGLRAARWTHLLELHLSNSFSDETGHLFLAQQLSQGPSAPEETEVLALRRLPLKEAVALTQNGEITDALSVIALQHIWIRYREGLLPGLP